MICNVQKYKTLLFIDKEQTIIINSNASMCMESTDPNIKLVFFMYGFRSQSKAL